MAAPPATDAAHRRQPLRDEVCAGTFLFVPRGVLHATANPGAQPARYLAWFTPAGMEGYFAERAAIVDAAKGHPAPAQLDALRLHYGMVFAEE